MNKMKLSAVLMTILFLASVTCTTMPIYAKPKIIHVPKDYATIQAAVNAANDGDIILVHAGVYSESVSIVGFSSLTLQTKGNVIIDPPGESAGGVNGFTVYSDGVTIKGFEITGANFGIWFEGSNNRFSHNEIHGIYSAVQWWDGGIGISLWDLDGGSDYNEITNNKIHDVERNGVLLDIAWTDGGTGGNIGNKIEHNEVYDFGWYGIEAANAKETVINHNTVYDGATYGILLITYAWDTMENEIHHNKVLDLSCGIALLHVGGGGSIKENTIHHNKVSDTTSWGILLYDWGGAVENNVVHHNKAPSYLDTSGNNLDFKNSWN